MFVNINKHVVASFFRKIDFYNLLFFFFIYFRSSINFGVFSADQIQQLATVQCVAKSLYTPDATRTPVPYGVLDKKLVCGITFIFALRSAYFLYYVLFVISYNRVQVERTKYVILVEKILWSVLAILVSLILNYQYFTLVTFVQQFQFSSKYARY